MTCIRSRSSKRFQYLTESQRAERGVTQIQGISLSVLTALTLVHLLSGKDISDILSNFKDKRS